MEDEIVLQEEAWRGEIEIEGRCNDKSGKGIIAFECSEKIRKQDSMELNKIVYKFILHSLILFIASISSIPSDSIFINSFYSFLLGCSSSPANILGELIRLHGIDCYRCSGNGNGNGTIAESPSPSASYLPRPCSCSCSLLGYSDLD